jgi:hypothetical protein
MAKTLTVTIDGALLRRGFWIYVWEISPPNGQNVLYVGRTGDTSSPNAQSLFNRLGQNLSATAKNASMVRNHLETRGIDPSECQFRMVGYGPIFDEVPNKDLEAHKPIRDKVGAIEQKLAEDLRTAGYDVMNTVPGKKTADKELYEPVRLAFAAEFRSL